MWKEGYIELRLDGLWPQMLGIGMRLEWKYMNGKCNVPKKKSKTIGIPSPLSLSLIGIYNWCRHHPPTYWVGHYLNQVAHFHSLWAAPSICCWGWVYNLGFITLIQYIDAYKFFFILYMFLYLCGAIVS